MSKLFYRSSILLTTALFVVSGFFVFAGIASAVDTVLGVTQITATKTFATADGTYANGWSWVFDVTVPTNETTLNMKFADWVSGSNIISAANNIRFFSAQSLNAFDAGHAITISAANNYSDNMYLMPSSDGSVALAGRQIQITIEAAVPIDSVGGSYSTSYGIQTDPTLPVITAPIDQTFEATGASTTPTLIEATATDIVDPSPVITYTPHSFPVGEDQEVTWTATDVLGTQASATSEVTITDTTAPIITAPADQTFEATGASTTPTLTQATATDVVDPNPVITYAPNSFPVGETTVTWTATDAAGKSATITSTVTIIDTTKPTINGTPVDITVESASGLGMVVTYIAPTATDLVDGTVVVNCSPASGSTFVLGTIAVTCTATDTATNTATSTFNVTVQDTTAPTLNVIGFTANGISMPGDINSGYSLSINGNANTHYQIQFATGSVALENLQTEDVGLVLQPTAGQTVALQTFYSTNYPVVYEAYLKDAAAGINPFAYIKTGGTAIQILDGAQKFLADTETDMLVPGNYPLGAYTVTGTIHDVTGNPTTVTYILRVVDTTAPVITAPADQTFGATGPTTAIIPPTLIEATATDNIDPNPAITYDIHSFPVGETTVIWTATDASGNSSTTTSKVTITDATAPDITAPVAPDPQTFEATGPTTTPILVEATATDVVDPSPVITYTPQDFPVGANQEVVWTATDASGNSSTTTSKVTITDKTTPTISATSDMTVEATSAAGADVIYTPPTATDLVDSTVTVTCLPASGSTFPVGETTLVTCTATDSATNTATSTFTVTVQDKTASVITLLGIGNNGNPSYVIVGESYVDAGATCTDLVDGDLTVKIVVTGLPINTSVLGSHTVNYSCTDNAENTVTADRTVNVITASQKITINSSIGGSISAVATTFTNPKYEITANADYYIVDVSVDGSSVIGQTGFEWITGNTDASYTFTNVIAPHTLSATFELNPPVTLTSIAIITPATKLSYTVGESLDIAGLMVTGTYSDASKKVETITTGDVLDFDSSVPVIGQVLTITSGGKTATYTVDIFVPADINKNGQVDAADFILLKQNMGRTGCVLSNSYCDGADINKNGQVDFADLLILQASFGPIAVISPATVNLGTASNFVILSKSGISTTGTTAITGDIGVSPAAASYITEFGLSLDSTGCFSVADPSGLVIGKIYAADYGTNGCKTPAVLTTAVSDMQTAYTDAAGRPHGVGPNLNLGGGTVATQTLAPGVYTWGSDVTITGDITLAGTATDVWIFQISGTLNLADGVKINLSGGALPQNIFWQVADVVTLKPGSHLEGNILAQTNIAMQTGATLNGRALAQTAVTLDANAVTVP